MTCRDDGWIQAYLDGESDGEAAAHFTEHLASCAACQQRLDELMRLEKWTKEQMDAYLASSKDQVQVDTSAAWQRFSQTIGTSSTGKIATQRENKNQTLAKRGVSGMKKRTRQWITGASAAAVVAISLSFPQVQAAANDLLAIFRVDKVEFVKLTQEDLQQAENWISSSGAGELELEGIGKVWIDQNDQKQERSRWFDSLEEAQEAGVTLPQLPDGFTVDGVDVNYPFTLHMEFDVEKANKLFAQLQMEERFDEQLDGKRFSMNIPESIYISLQKNDAHYSYNVVQGLELEAPEGTDLGQLRDTVLALPFVPENVKKQLLAIDNWEETLPMPYVENGDGKTKEVKINGEKALLMISEHHATLTWQKNGSLHFLNGYENGAEDELVEIAKKLK